VSHVIDVQHMHHDDENCSLLWPLNLVYIDIEDMTSLNSAIAEKPV